MTAILRIGGLVLLLLLADIQPVGADLYYWTDKKGVRHYSNTKPPDGEEATVLMEEIPYDPETDDQRRQEEDTMLEEAEKDALQERLEDAERKAEEARRQAEAAKRKADRLEQELKEQEEDRSYGVYYPYRWYGQPGWRPPGHRPPGHRPPGNKPPAWHPPRPRPHDTSPRESRPQDRGAPSQGQTN
jgi:hypothetical protein